MNTPTRSSYSPKKVMLVLLLTLAATSPAKATLADSPLLETAARETAVPLKTAVESLKLGRYGEPERSAAVKALAQLETASAGLSAQDGDLAALRDAILEARAIEAASPSEMTTLTSKLEAVVSALDKLFPAAAALPAFNSAADAPRHPQQAPETAGTTAAIEHIQDGGATNPTKADRFWDNSAHRRTADDTAVAADGAQRRRRIRTMIVPKPDDVAVPGLGQESNPAAACQGVLADRTFLAGLCGTQPQAALLLAGLMDAVKQQFGTLQGLGTVVIFALAGLLLAAASGLGLIAKAITTLLAAGMMIEGAIPLLKESYRSFGDWLSSAAGSREQGLALRRVGQAGGAVLLMVAMAVIGGRIGKTPAAKAIAANTEAVYSTMFNKLGLPGGLAAAEAALPVPVKTAMVKVFGGSPLTIGTAKGKIPASIPNPATPEALTELLAQQPLRDLAFSRVKFDQKFTALPDGVSAKVQPGLDSIRRLFADQQRVTKLMQDFEAEVVGRTLRTGEPLNVSRENILARSEALNGFKPVVELPVKSYDKPEWRAMLKEGALFKDTAFKDANRQGSRHGYETHRLQWHLVMREMAARPESFGKVEQASDLFKFIGAVDDAALDWKKTGVSYNQTAWYQLFDSNEKNFSSPEFFRDQHRHFPGLGGWY